MLKCSSSLYMLLGLVCCVFASLRAWLSVTARLRPAVCCYCFVAERQSPIVQRALDFNVVPLPPPQLHLPARQDQQQPQQQKQPQLGGSPPSASCLPAPRKRPRVESLGQCSAGQQQEQQVGSTGPTPEAASSGWDHLLVRMTAADTDAATEPLSGVGAVAAGDSWDDASSQPRA